MTMITTTDDLTAACARLGQSSVLTVDTEFLRDSTFWPQLCLIQVAGDDFYCAIDTLAPKLDLAPFYELMRDEKILKVFHSARQDVEIFVHEMGGVPYPLFDTQVAAMVCGYGESVGYETLVNKLTGAKLDKAVRFTDWSKRPLSRRQIDYALGDVIHLRDVFAKLFAKLEQNGRGSWIDEEMAVLTDTATYRLHPEDAWRRLKPRSRNRRFLALVQALAEWRETEAQRKNVPRNRIVRDDIIMELAAHPPHTEDELGAIRGFSKRSAESKEGQSLLAAVARAEALPDSDLPEAEHEDRSVGNSPLSDLIKVLLKLRCQENGVAPKLVASSGDLELIAQGGHPEIAALHGWRYELFGRDAEAIREGRLGLAVRGGRLVILDIQDDGTAVTRA
ncbi:ribonuclease D [Govanella unica]|uniref:Ribonuclease D n=1 Tax=Govanella unica TaxID=2975056 RepID=A0A9X3TZ39_9PROT|nr:ribonuclease D [Govania unica]MDA5194380.1 ribonuclease D [Govania unica]